MPRRARRNIVNQVKSSDDFSGLSYKELRKMAVEKKLFRVGMNTAALIEALSTNG